MAKRRQHHKSEWIYDEISMGGDGEAAPASPPLQITYMYMDLNLYISIYKNLRYINIWILNCEMWLGVNRGWWRRGAFVFYNFCGIYTYICEFELRMCTCIDLNCVYTYEFELCKCTSSKGDEALMVMAKRHLLCLNAWGICTHELALCTYTRMNLNCEYTHTF